MSRQHENGRGRDRSGYRDRLLRALWNPRWGLACRGAVTASLAWLAAELAPAPLSDYAYYAPLGAVAATSSTAIRSARDSVQAMIAMLLGAAVALGVDLLELPGTVSVGLVVGITLLLAGWHVLGQMGTWTATCGLFVLLLGSAHDLSYPLAFAGLLLMGAMFGVTLNLILPPLPLAPSDVALDRLREELVDQLDALASQMESNEPLSADEWEERRRDLVPTLHRAQNAVAHLREATRANRRMRRFDGHATEQIRRAERLSESTDVVDDAVGLLTSWERQGLDAVAFGPDLRPALATTLRFYARAVDAATDPEAEGAKRDVARFTDAVDALSGHIESAARTSRHHYFVATTLIVVFWRGGAVLAAR